jgi:hypothetical protein
MTTEKTRNRIRKRVKDAILKSTDINDNTRELMIKHLEDIVEAGIKTKGHITGAMLDKILKKE